MKLLVVGAGEMGRWAARTLRPVSERVALADTNPQTAMDAAEDVVDGRVVPVDTDESFDCVVLAVPIPVVADAVAKYADNAAGGALVDVSGVMAEPLSAMADHAAGEYASFHPLFAPPRGPGRIAYVPGRSGRTVDRVRERFAAVCNEVFETTAAEHDDAMAKVQTGAHTAVLAYALAAGDVDERFHTPVSEPLAEIARTVTEGEPRVYADIRETFDGDDAVAEAARAVAAADRDEFAALFERAGDAVNTESRVDGDDGDDAGTEAGNDERTDGPASRVDE
ncbi:prephenate dehydrogenase/arogenate dehydrogenase family protein [Halobaculum magnesiiphilum]|uniref:Prephenate dehydrogenase/arogenate dehydrogenase family protein n=1 Tax=Halobaculum magnesiiphilum TaxID=1017351 RepID=A0A8T8WE44_9EURY|nr:prephenate dehydrogenase/arogenate dehydrogenase family protein [Halobaculum magnesiiphilum]QZP38142.1 prephenate dehydrogenase/arogenate dehydrogenase family protein [Halobaculum magnesiiphilum]